MATTRCMQQDSSSRTKLGRYEMFAEPHFNAMRPIHPMPLQLSAVLWQPLPCAVSEAHVTLSKWSQLSLHHGYASQLNVHFDINLTAATDAASLCSQATLKAIGADPRLANAASTAAGRPSSQMHSHANQYAGYKDLAIVVLATACLLSWAASTSIWCSTRSSGMLSCTAEDMQTPKPCKARKEHAQSSRGPSACASRSQRSTRQQQSDSLDVEISIGGSLLATSQPRSMLRQLSNASPDRTMMNWQRQGHGRLTRNEVSQIP